MRPLAALQIITVYLYLTCHVQAQFFVEKSQCPFWMYNDTTTPGGGCKFCKVCRVDARGIIKQYNRVINRECTLIPEEHHLILMTGETRPRALHCSKGDDAKCENINDVYPVRNGAWKCDNTLDPTWYMYFTNCTLQCDGGYELQGTPTVQCGSNLTWGNDIPSCNPVPTTAVAMTTEQQTTSNSPPPQGQDFPVPTTAVAMTTEQQTTSNSPPPQGQDFLDWVIPVAVTVPVILLLAVLAYCNRQRIKKLWDQLDHCEHRYFGKCRECLMPETVSQHTVETEPMLPGVFLTKHSEPGECSDMAPVDSVVLENEGKGRESATVHGGSTELTHTASIPLLHQSQGQSQGQTQGQTQGPSNSDPKTVFNIFGDNPCICVSGNVQVNQTLNYKHEQNKVTDFEDNKNGCMNKLEMLELNGTGSGSMAAQRVSNPELEELRSCEDNNLYTDDQLRTLSGLTGTRMTGIAQPNVPLETDRLVTPRKLPSGQSDEGINLSENESARRGFEISDSHAEHPAETSNESESGIETSGDRSGTPACEVNPNASANRPSGLIQIKKAQHVEIDNSVYIETDASPVDILPHINQGDVTVEGSENVKINKKIHIKKSATNLTPESNINAAEPSAEGTTTVSNTIPGDTVRQSNTDRHVAENDEMMSSVSALLAVPTHYPPKTARPSSKRATTKGKSRQCHESPTPLENSCTCERCCSITKELKSSSELSYRCQHCSLPSPNYKPRHCLSSSRLSQNGQTQSEERCNVRHSTGELCSGTCCMLGDVGASTCTNDEFAGTEDFHSDLDMQENHGGWNMSSLQSDELSDTEKD